MRSGTRTVPASPKTPTQNITYLRNKAANYNTANPGYGFDDDPLHTPVPGQYFGFLTRAPNPVP